jgi:uncharacterized cupredoxin-like copper-binding protein
MNKKLVLFVMMILVWTVSACGKSGPSTNLSFTMNDFSFDPNEFTVPAGKEITVHVTHHGSMEHNFIIMKLGLEAGEMFDDADKANVFWEIDLQPGDSETVVFTAPEQPGTYQIICGMPGHLQSGMLGKLVVTD